MPFRSLKYLWRPALHACLYQGAALLIAGLLGWGYSWLGGDGGFVFFLILGSWVGHFLAGCDQVSDDEMTEAGHGR